MAEVDSVCLYLAMSHGIKGSITILCCILGEFSPNFARIKFVKFCYGKRNSFSINVIAVSCAVPNGVINKSKRLFKQNFCSFRKRQDHFITLQCE